MNMPALDSQTNQHQKRHFIAEAVLAVESLKNQQNQEKQQKAIHLLDKMFPLDKGSHENVACYIRDGRHLMAYFADGTHCGLDKPGQFVAYTGRPEHPYSIVLRDKTGSHIEVIFKKGSNESGRTPIEIADIQLETCATFPNMESETPECMRHWVSLIKRDETGHPVVCLDDKDYTAKNGDDYFLNCCY
ncbi:hypothetical protein L3Q72_06880 [Vibrio sp. JC009]|uniref:hypothetical protein n=1 Tax=Vibrio sp. JC009 TaxID=2912314 RepID=UPI0023B0D961|nr:hypothetical protein [Vibrio sp. JC009]WED23111.1 hypothetical protein L3Q72_06880 [Vibrio sp. JC009]